MAFVPHSYVGLMRHSCDSAFSRCTIKLLLHNDTTFFRSCDEISWIYMTVSFEIPSPAENNGHD